jgi:N6-adenosine-specific RNA methylase IME4
MARRSHPKKDVEEALKYAESKGWTVEVGWGHWGRMKCPNHSPEGCLVSINGTPRNAGNHGRQLMRAVDRCNCGKP